MRTLIRGSGVSTVLFRTVSRSCRASDMARANKVSHPLAAVLCDVTEERKPSVALSDKSLEQLQLLRLGAVLVGVRRLFSGLDVGMAAVGKPGFRLLVSIIQYSCEFREVSLCAYGQGGNRFTAKLKASITLWSRVSTTLLKMCH